METYTEKIEITEGNKHLTLPELKEPEQKQQKPIKYLQKISPDNRYKIPAYPRPELHITHVSHSTKWEGLDGIKTDGGFRDPKMNSRVKVVWFSLTVTPEDLSDAETRDLTIVRPGGVEEQSAPIRRRAQEEAGGAQGEAGGAQEEAGGAQGEAGGAQGEAGGAQGRQWSSGRQGSSGEAGGAQGRQGGAQGEAGGAQGEAGGAQGEAGGAQGEAGGAQEEAGGAQGEAGGAQGEAGGAVGAGVLVRFATSPVFLSSSRYGSYRFTFDLRDVLQQYSEQFCGGQTPVMRKWKTVLYSQEVLYAVLVHSPDHEDQKAFEDQEVLKNPNLKNCKIRDVPLLEDTPNSICAFRQEPEPHFVWRPQAMCETHELELVGTGEDVSVEDGHCEFFVWDHVALALVVGEEVLRFDDDKLRKSLRFCERGERKINLMITFESYHCANSCVQDLWPDSEDLERYNKSRFHIPTGH
ncbi:uncharacterized protein LOC129409878 [Boleophthalmus pectinirostris]|uniref:uncharacterized protein LOC129409878 n=1 Tax=Boleophthalmus pectinirostris TaxID=150288 RepID=UPI0024317E95|nr:uncharacterized protein LOC129409878 [Boleophthalmus pectinirostris]